MEHQLQEVYSDNGIFKAILTQRSATVVMVQIYKRNEGYIMGQGHVHDPIWEIITGPIFTGSLKHTKELANAEFTRLL